MKLKSFEHIVDRTFGGRPFRRTLSPDGGFWMINNVKTLIIQFADDKTFSIIANDEDDDVRFTPIGPFKSLKSAAVAATLMSST